VFDGFLFYRSISSGASSGTLKSCESRTSCGTVNVVTFEICSRAGGCTLTVHPVLSLDVFETPRGCRGGRGMDNIIRFCPLAEISRFF
jgi:hypothetical protein